MLAAMNAFYGWALATHRVARNPFIQVGDKEEETDGAVIYLSFAERNRIIRLMEKHKDLNARLAVGLALYSGLRQIEIERLDWAQLNLRTRFIEVLKQKTPRRKKKRRRVPISKELLAIFQQVPESKRSGKVLKWVGAETPGYHFRIMRGWIEKRLCTAGGIDREKIDFRVFRHTFCTLHAQAGTKINDILEWTGHSYEVFRTRYLGEREEHNEAIDLVDAVTRTDAAKEKVG